jgi:Reverse transcriptase (RNA-dependent DNA polymerase)
LSLLAPNHDWKNVRFKKQVKVIDIERSIDQNDEILISQGSPVKSNLPYPEIADISEYPPEPGGDRIFRFMPLGNGKCLEERLSSRWDLEYDPNTKFHVRTAYKRKADKIRPSDDADPTIQPEYARKGWREAIEKELIAQSMKISLGPFDGLITRRYSTEPVGFRLTPERKQALRIGDTLTSREREILLAVLQNRETTLAWDWTHVRRIRHDVAPPQKIETIPHKAWQVPTFPIPNALRPKVVQMLQDRIKAGVYEICHGPYRNPWFLVKKKEKDTYRAVFAGMKLNEVTRRDANIPPPLEQFAEDFAGMKIVSLVDMFSGYDQVELHKDSRDRTAILTPVGLLRLTTLPQGCTNSVGQFVRVTRTILGELLGCVAEAFLDDIGVKGSKSDYGGEEALPGVRRYVLEHIQNIDRVLVHMECANAVVAGGKSHFACERLKIVGFTVGPDGRSPTAEKVYKIQSWPPPRDAKEARGFIGLVVYYRLWIESFT